MVARASLIHVATLVALGLVAAPRPALASPGAEPPWLGVGISHGAHGVRVDEVIANTPADDAGLIPGDEIISVARVPVLMVNELQLEVTRYRVGDRVALGVQRGPRVVELVATLGPRLGPGEILYRRLAGRPVPFFDAAVVAGSESGNVEHVRGHVLVVAFFATECRECSDMHQRLSRLADEHARDGLVVLAVSREPRQAIEAWAARMAPSFTVLHDVWSDMFRAFRVDHVPAIVVVNRDGEIAYAGTAERATVERAIVVAGRALRGARAARAPTR